MVEANRFLILAGGVAGAIGVGLSAKAAHSGGTNLATAASFLLMHAPALLALAVISRSRFMTLSAATLALGLALFCGDLVARDILGTRLFPFAAPAGGILLIAGWLGIVLSALIAPRNV